MKEQIKDIIERFGENWGGSIFSSTALPVFGKRQGKTTWQWKKWNILFSYCKATVPDEDWESWRRRRPNQERLSQRVLGGTCSSWQHIFMWMVGFLNWRRQPDFRGSLTPCWGCLTARYSAPMWPRQQVWLISHAARLGVTLQRPMEYGWRGKECARFV